MRYGLLVLTASLVVLPIASEAQVRAGYTDIGPTIGLGNINGASFAFGGRFEHVFKRLPDLGNGHLGIQANADVWTYDVGVGSGNFDVRTLAFGGTLNYHFNVESNTKIDPFLGIGLGVTNVSTDSPLDYNSGLELIGRAGLRYLATSNLAFYGDLGAGAASLNVGVMFRLKSAR